MFHQRIIIVTALLLPGCRETAGELEADTVGDDGDGKVECTLADLPLQEPMWLEFLPEGPTGRPLAPGLVVTADAIFSAGYYIDDNEPTNGHNITRWTLDGQIEWSVDAPNYDITAARSLAWDGQHLYYATRPDKAVRRAGLERVDGNGESDEWVYESGENFDIADIDVSNTQVLAAAFQDVFADPGYTDAVWVSVDKLDWLALSQDFFGELNENERASAIIPWSMGGHIVAMNRPFSPNNAVFLRGYQGATLSVDTSFSGTPVAHFMHERPEGLLVVVAVDNSELWVMMVNPDGSEAWRKPLVPCDDPTVEMGLSSVAVGSDRLFASVGIRLETGTQASMIIEFGFDGELQATHTLTGGPLGTVQIDAIASNGDVVVVSGYNYIEEFTGWIARIR